MWKELIQGFSDEATFEAPATEQQIIAVEDALKIGLPDDLKALLLETNGLFDSTMANFIYSTDEIIQSNQNMRTFEGFEDLYMPFDNLLIFGEDGGGDLFAFSITKNGQFGFGLFRWNHEDDSRTSMSVIRLQDFIQTWLTDREVLEQS